MEEREYNIHINSIMESKINIRKKFNKYIENKKIKDEVKKIFTEIFYENNEISKKLYEELMMIIDNEEIDKKEESKNEIITNIGY
jgi:hypothetical protein